MRTSRTLITIAMLAVTATALAVPSVRADPINGKGKAVTPRAIDVVGVGSGTLQYLFDQFSLDYNAKVKASAPHLYSWDATNPATGLANDLIQTKAGCAKIVRPDGSAAGISTLAANVRDPASSSHYCVDFASSALARTPTDPPPRPGGIQFVPFGKDAVTWAVNATSNAPGNLTTAELVSIYTCKVTNWKQVGGKNAPIDAQLPQPGSDTRTLFLAALGGGRPITPGRCVDSSRNERPDNLPQENEGVSTFLKGPDVIYPYSIGTYLTQAFRSASCLVSSCTRVKGRICELKKHDNRFGCDTRGILRLGCILDIAPTEGTGSHQTTNPEFSPAYVSTVFVVVRWAKATAGNIPRYLQGIFGPKGWVFTSAAARTDLRNYGFLPEGTTAVPLIHTRSGCGD
jgi:ABC-type phosphate transport system substrate-binding protein